MHVKFIHENLFFLDIIEMESSEKSDTNRLKLRSLSIRSNGTSPLTPRRGPKHLTSAAKRNQAKIKKAKGKKADGKQQNSSDEGR